MSRVKIIKTAQEHKQALARLDNLMKADPVPGSAEADELDVLALLIEHYDQEQFLTDFPDPVAAIKCRMQQQGLRKKDLVAYIGSASKVTEVLNGTRGLSLNMIRNLTDGLGISASLLIREPSQKVANYRHIDWLGFPLVEMYEGGYFEHFTGSLQELKESAAEQVSQFLSAVPEGFSLQPAMPRSRAHLRSSDKTTDSYALWAWQVRVLQKAQEAPLPTHYCKGQVDLAWMQKLAQLSWSVQGPLLAKEYLNRSGIHVIFEPHLPKTCLDGAVCLSQTGNPIIGLTLRHDRLDSFWFTLMHELAHIALHMDGTKTWFMDDLEVAGGDEKELEASALAQEALLPAEAYASLTHHDAESVRKLAQILNIEPCIVAGRLRHELGNHQLFGTLFRNRVNLRLI